MHALSGQEILRIWEVGLGQHPLDRALTMLEMAFPEYSQDELTEFSIGQRDAHLLAIRERTFGSRLVSMAECPACRERLEFVLNANELYVGPGTGIEDVEQKVHVMTIDDYELHFRLPNSLDLAAIAGCRDVAAARSLLVRCCVLQALQDGAEVAVESLPEIVTGALAARMAEYDPQAEMGLELTCLACDYSWRAILDIVVFLWAEICAQAKRLLGEVHTLARAYGWREADILSMTAARRQFYLEMVS